MVKHILVDTHTHTVLSGHAWSTLRENCAAAARKGMEAIVMTEHGHAIPGSGPFFLVAAQRMLPPLIEGIRVYYGAEANIIDLQGGLDIDEKSLFQCEFCIASMHDLCMEPGSEGANTDAYIQALAKPYVDILGHIDDRRTPSHFDVVVREAARLGKLIEMNNNSLLVRRGSRERARLLAEACAEAGTRVAVSSDAHFDEMIGAVDPALAMLDAIGFPEELIVNRTLASFQEYLEERTARVEAVRPPSSRWKPISPIPQ